MCLTVPHWLEFGTYVHVVLAHILWLLAGLFSLKDSLDKGQVVKGADLQGFSVFQFGQAYYSNKWQGQGYYSDKGQGQGYYCLSQEFFGLSASAGSGIVTVLGIFLLF